ncbi:hypothetical protein R3Q06_20485 [Rhodococcus erythropolis]|uniref:hypothetical protein n=1 Tax=Rhodococcus erythropolis TaxID=1833 RepID=UPI002948F865|nr:hypothetical protein [Rhodococcus erythropolis]MDV6275876.1 hypothetical protein [Rhodococcus erythropolis]
MSNELPHHLIVSQGDKKITVTIEHIADPVDYLAELLSNMDTSPFTATGATITITNGSIP